ncbi:MAG: isopentenyl phosphate kinase [Anaerolineae bacterium]|nr:isopentenyl phosphate kinase [Anaerolineae bacterium]
MITLLKIGGSLITDKNQQATFRQTVMAQVAAEISAALASQPTLKLIIGHGSGSFGHFEAARYNTMTGVQSADEWVGFAKVATIAAELNYLVAKELHKVTIPALRIQPSASILAEDGVIKQMSLRSVERALENNLIPLIYGDVAFDTVRGGTIVSTETIFTYFASQLPINRIILLGEVDGVYDNRQNIIETITPANFQDYQSALGASGGVDVTGGMLSKVQDMLKLASREPYPVIQIINGTRRGIIRDALTGVPVKGTTIKVN